MEKCNGFPWNDPHRFRLIVPKVRVALNEAATGKIEINSRPQVFIQVLFHYCSDWKTLSAGLAFGKENFFAVRIPPRE